MSGFSALVLAGSRDEPDVLRAYAGVTHKALIELGGQTLLSRVVAAVRGAGAGRIGVSTSHPDVMAAAAGLEIIAAGASPSQSVATAAEVLGFPLLVTTSDHALLQADWISRFLADVPADADIAALLAPEAVVRAAAPDTVRSYLKFRDGRYSGCNLFYLSNARALAAITLWRRVEAHRKQPWKIAALLGPGMLLGYLLGRLSLDDAVAGLGRRIGIKAAAVRTPYGLAAVDVDKPSDLDLVRRLANP